MVQEGDTSYEWPTKIHVIFEPKHKWICKRNEMDIHGE